MFIALHELDERTETGARAIGGDDPSLQAHPGLLFDNRSDYIFWALLARENTYPTPGGIQRLDGGALQQVALRMIDGWHPRLQRLVRDSDASTIICKPLQAAQPVKQWRTRHITLLGDAIHSMPPTRGIGGNTALRDAQLLCEQLIAVGSGDQPLLTAIHRYETEMLKYGFAAVRSSMQALQLHVAGSRLVSNTLLRSVDGLLALQRLSLRQAA